MSIDIETLNTDAIVVLKSIQYIEVGLNINRA